MGAVREVIDFAPLPPEVVARHRLALLAADRSRLGAVVDGLVRPGWPAPAGVVQRRLSDLDRSLGALAAVLEAPLDASAWTVLDKTRRAVDRESALVLGLLGGLALAAPDGPGATGTAQAWVDELRLRATVPEPLTVVPAVDRHEARTGLGLVPVPLTGVDLWELPLLADSVATVAAARPDDERDAVLAAHGREPELRAVLPYVIATVLAGPAYPIAFAVLELDLAPPARADISPMGAMLETLRCLDAAGLTSPHQVGPYRSVLAHLDDLTRDAVPSGGLPAVADLYREIVAPRFAEPIAATRRAWEWALARCAGWAGAPGSGRHVPPDGGFLAVLNALWLAKLERPDADDHYLERVVDGLRHGQAHTMPAPGRPLRGVDVAALRVQRTERRWRRLHGLLTDPAVPARLRDALGGRFLRLLSEQLQLLADEAPTVEAGRGGPRTWAALQRVESAGRPVRQEALEVLGACRLPADHATTSPAALADDLLAGLARRTGVGFGARAIPAPAPMLDTATDVVRARFPDPAGWSALLTAHEFGHLIARDTPRFTPWRAERAVRPPLDELPPATAESWLEELFADVFATYTAGPAFACATLALHFDPAAARSPRGSHPPHALRVQAILATLHAMNDRERPSRHYTGPYGGVIAMLDGTWTAAVTSAGADAPEADQAWAALAIELIALVHTHYRLGAAYDPTRWAAACGLAERVLAEGVTGAWTDPPPEMDAVDVLTTLWLARLTGSAPPDVLGSVGARWIAHLLGGAGDD